jgi:hypothetical protein
MHDETRRQTHASSSSPVLDEAQGNVEKIVSEEVEEEDGRRDVLSSSGGERIVETMPRV